MTSACSVGFTFSSSSSRGLGVFALCALSLSVSVSSVCLSESRKGSPSPKQQIAPAAKIQDRIVASIDGEPVSLSDLMSFWKLRAPTPGAALPGDPQALKAITQEFVLGRLIEKEAAATGIQITDEEMNTYLSEVLKQNRVDLPAFQTMVAARGMTVDQYKSQIRGEVLRSRVIGARIRSKVAVSKSDIEKVMGTPEEENTDALRLEQIFVPKGESYSLTGELDIEGARSVAADLKSRVDGGESFSSVGGDRYTDIGAVNPGDLLPEISEAAESLDEGETSEIIEGERGFYLVRRLTADEGKSRVERNPEAESIKQEIQEERSKEQVEKFLGEELPKKYNVEYRV